MAIDKKINGNISGIKDTVLEAMAAIYDLRMTGDEFASVELLSSLAKYTGIISREISVYISRDGRICDVSVGDSSAVSMPQMRLVRNIDRLSGIRCIHTHPGGDGRLSGVDLGTLRSSSLDAMAALGVKDGKFINMYAAYLGDIGENGERTIIIYGPMRPDKLPNRQLLDEIILADKRMRSSTVDVSDKQKERTLLCGMESDAKEEYDSLAELAELAKTAGADVVGSFSQRKRPIDNATYIGSGKAEELAKKANELNADLIIFDDELSAIQLRNLETVTSTRVIDRTQLILDIFAARATSREGRLQVELAQQRYRLPRLLGQGTVLSRLGGGIGTRGPGEKKLEIDRRRIRRRVFELEQEFKEVEKQRSLRRENRQKGAFPLIALVGYTNAGKSTLTNKLSGAQEYVCDQLFATLDTVVRKISLPRGTAALISDTVGFINKLPHELVQAFHSTLEEVKNADIILHVVDSSSPYAQTQIEVVQDVLQSLEAANIPQILVLNKSDKENAKTVFSSNAQQIISISAATGSGIDSLLEALEQMLSQSKTLLDIVIPYDKYALISFIRENGSILEENHMDDGTHIKVMLDNTSASKLKSMLDK